MGMRSAQLAARHEDDGEWQMTAIGHRHRPWGNGKCEMKKHCLLVAKFILYFAESTVLCACQ
jgi:hypothetical protein